MRRIKTLSSLGLLFLSTSSQAVDFKLADGKIDGSWVTNLTAGAGIRTKNPSCSLTGDPSAHGCGSAANVDQWGFGDMGDLNYRKWQPFSASLSATSEVLLKMPSEGWKMLVRGTAYYDFAASHTDRTPLSSEARAQLVRDVQLFDAWVEKDFRIGSQSAYVRLGNQVLNWGESYFATGGINQTNSVDIQRLLVPGTQLKQALLPAPMLSFATGIASGLSAEAYYQFRWNGNRYPPVGGYWSVGNNFGRGALPTTVNSTNFNVGGLDAGSIAGPRAGDGATIAAISNGLVNGDYAGAPFYSIGVPVSVGFPKKNMPQFGVKLVYKPNDLDVNFGFYYENYTDKAPVLATLADGTNRFTYRENRQLFGASANFALGDWAIGSELSYRPKDAVALSACYGAGGAFDSNTNSIFGVQCNQWVDRKKLQFDLNGQLSLTQSSYPILKLLNADMATLTTELALINYPGLDRRGVRSTVGGVNVVQGQAAGYYTWLNRNAGLGYPIIASKGTATSAGATVDFNWTYDGTLISGWQLTPGVTYTHAIYGYTPTFTANYLQGAKSANLYLLFNQNPATWQAGINYSMFFGGHETVGQAYADRNFIGMFLTRNF